ncbi:hypothetical protein HHK36_022194 [Tetracentron sinense]|uniref:TMEM205-like domain-containing protein n=1 Tax=Tetracentron sinense TaxID=13715 RepID=A0A834YRH2_TETSI|nr:hypothetical protein HHK36_022194 [Tetracentron sinense]
MFPAFFSMVCVCCATSVASFGYFQLWKSKSAAERYQLGFLLAAFAFILTNMFVFTPMIIETNLVGEPEIASLIQRIKEGGNIAFFRGNFPLSRIQAPYLTRSKETENLISFDLYQGPDIPDVLSIT